VTDDADLVPRALAGDRDAFAAIYDRYADRIHDFCRSMLRDADEAADVTQETFVRAWQHLASLRDPARLRAWLYSIARHETLRRVRRASRLARTPVPELPAPAAEGPPERVEEAELRELVWSAAAGLEPRDQVILDLSVRQGLDGTELAEALGVRRDHAYVLVSNVRKRVERVLGAFLVARLARADCTDLGTILEGWDGRWSPEVRRKVVRHADGCSVCTERRASLASPLALLSAVPVVAAPAALRDRTLSALGPAPRAPGRRRYPPRARSGRSVAVTAVAVTAAIAVVTAGIAAFVAAGGSEEGESAPDAVFVTGGGAGGTDFCVIAREWVATLPAPFRGPASPAPADVESYFRTNAAYLRRLEPLAPAAITGDVTSLSDAYDELVAELEAAEFSIGAVAAAGEDPELSAASERLEAHLTTQCGVP
jgi:RNA polymerase sigma factor (sigma-70 family)